MRDIYLPAAENYVYEEDGDIKGFVSLHGNTLAALFVMPEAQGRGIGRMLLNYAKLLRPSLELRVYCKNAQAVRFYKMSGFVIIEEGENGHTGEPEWVMRYA